MDTSSSDEPASAPAAEDAASANRSGWVVPSPFRLGAARGPDLADPRQDPHPLGDLAPRLMRSIAYRHLRPRSLVQSTTAVRKLSEPAFGFGAVAAGDQVGLPTPRSRLGSPSAPGTRSTHRSRADPAPPWKVPMSALVRTQRGGDDDPVHRRGDHVYLTGAQQRSVPRDQAPATSVRSSNGVAGPPPASTLCSASLCPDGPPASHRVSSSTRRHRRSASRRGVDTAPGGGSARIA